MTKESKASKLKSEDTSKERQRRSERWWKIITDIISVVALPVLLELINYGIDILKDDAEYKLRLSYKGIYDNALVYENKEELHDAWLQTILYQKG